MQSSRPTLTKIMRDALRRAPSGEAPVWAWPLVCGAAVAGKTKAVAFEEGTLRVVVPDSNWRAQLTDMAEQYLAAMNRFVGPAVKRIEFEVAGKPHRPRGEKR